MFNSALGYLLGITMFLSGLYGGIGFFVLLGGNPALRQLSDHGFAEYWQQVDRYMGARMPVAGPLILLSILVSSVTLTWETGLSSASCLMIAAVLISIIDVVFTLKVNHPLNIRIQAWDLQQLPPDAAQIKMKVYNAFNVRQWLMITSFLCVVCSVWTLF